MSYTTLKIKTRADLDQCIRERCKGQRRRSSRIKKVCDAIEGFCEDVCRHDGGMVVYDGLCSWCGKRVISQFDILKEEGV